MRSNLFYKNLTTINKIITNNQITDTKLRNKANNNRNKNAYHKTFDIIQNHHIQPSGRIACSLRSLNRT